jgi:protease-4
MAEGKRGLKGALAGLGRGLDLIRRIVLTAIFWGVVVALIVILLQSGGPKVPSKAALVLNPKGAVVEQLSGNPLSRITDQLTGQAEPEVLLKNLLDAVREAKTDNRIQALVLDLDQLGGIGMSKLLDLQAALADFKKSGKKVIAAGDNYDQNQYFLAAQADEVLLHPMGMVLLEGFGRYITYYKEGLDKLEVEVHVFRVGEYKSAVEPFLRNDMSDEAKQANLEYMDDLWGDWLKGASAGRKIKADDLKDYIDRFKDHLVENQGQTAQMALKARLVDKLATRDEVRKRLIALVGENEDTHSFHQIGYEDYLEAVGGDRTGANASGPLVAVVVAKGQIYDGSRPAGEVGGDSTAALLRDARNNKDVKAVVLRVDSPGGSAFASEVIRRECQLIRQAGKPLVISMGSVAASGGYWISTASDEIWASPATITGSIGIFGMFPTYDKPLAKYLGVHVDGVGTTPLAGAMRPDRPYNPEVGEVIQQIINRGYDEFLTRVAEARHMDKEAVNKIARGRVWSGEDALHLRLVDKLGGLPDAIASAAVRAKLGQDYKVRYIEKQLGWKEQLMADLMRGAVRISGGGEALPAHAPAFLAPARALARQAEAYASFNDPNGVYAYCPYAAE